MVPPRLSKEELIQNMDRVDREISMVEQQICKLKKKQVRPHPGLAPVRGGQGPALESQACSAGSREPLVAGGPAFLCAPRWPPVSRTSAKAGSGSGLSEVQAHSRSLGGVLGAGQQGRGQALAGLGGACRVALSCLCQGSPWLQSQLCPLLAEPGATSQSLYFLVCEIGADVTPRCRL